MENVWNHRKTRIDGEPIVSQGDLAFFDLTTAKGFYKPTETGGFMVGLEQWRFFSDSMKNEFGEKPAVMIVDLNIDETYYKIFIDDSFIWVKFDLIKPFSNS
jgi:hypothetical protein